MIFRYAAYSVEDGVVQGRIEADDVADARSQVQQLGYRPLQVATAWTMPPVEDMFPSLFKIKTGEMVRFISDLSTMLASGGNLLRSLEILQQQSGGRMLRRTIGELHRSLSAGNSLSAALAEHPKVFSPLLRAVAEVGESTGNLPRALDQVSDILRREHEAKQQAIRALTYPMLIIGLSVLTLGVLMTVAMPPLLGVFEDLGTELPLMTRALLAAINGVRGNFIPVALGLAGLVVCYRVARGFPSWQRRTDRAKFRVPVVGQLLITTELARVSRTIAMLLEAGVSLATALNLSRSGSSNLAMQQVLTDAEDSLMNGQTLSRAWRAGGMLPGPFVELVSIGEETNTLPIVMGDIAAAYQKKVEQQLQTMLGLIEPMSTVFIGLIVGIIAVSLFTPIYSSLDAIG